MRDRMGPQARMLAIVVVQSDPGPEFPHQRHHPKLLQIQDMVSSSSLHLLVLSPVVNHLHLLVLNLVANHLHLLVLKLAVNHLHLQQYHLNSHRRLLQFLNSRRRLLQDLNSLHCRRNHSKDTAHKVVHKVSKSECDTAGPFAERSFVY